MHCNTELLQRWVRSIRAGRSLVTHFMSVCTNCHTKGSPKQRKAMKSADFWGIPKSVSILNSFNETCISSHSLKSSVIIFLRLKKFTEETRSGDSNTGSIFLKVVIWIVLSTCLVLKNVSTEQILFVIYFNMWECHWKWVTTHMVCAPQKKVLPLSQFNFIVVFKRKKKKREKTKKTLNITVF